MYPVCTGGMTAWRQVACAHSAEGFGDATFSKEYRRVSGVMLRVCAVTLAQVGDLRDDHNYPDPISSGVTQTRASVAGEFGGLGYFVEGHTWIGSAADAFSAYPLMGSVSQLEVCAASGTPACNAPGWWHAAAARRLRGVHGRPAGACSGHPGGKLGCTAL